MRDCENIIIMKCHLKGLGIGGFTKSGCFHQFTKSRNEAEINGMNNGNKSTEVNLINQDPENDDNKLLVGSGCFQLKKQQLHLKKKGQKKKKTKVKAKPKKKKGVKKGGRKSKSGPKKTKSGKITKKYKQNRKKINDIFTQFL